METIPLEMAIHVGSYVIAAVVFVVGVKYAINGMREKVDHVIELLEQLRKTDAVQDNRLTRLETETAERLAWMQRMESELTGLRAQISDMS